MSSEARFWEGRHDDEQFVRDGNRLGSSCDDGAAGGVAMTVMLSSGRRAAVVMAVALGVVAAAAAVASGQPKQPAPPRQQSAQAAAQPKPPPSGPPNALQGFSQNRDQPIKINAAELEVHDKDKVATFSGKVHLVQGDTTMDSDALVVFYDDQASAPPPSAAGGAATAQITPQQNQQIKRVEARGNVVVHQKGHGNTGEPVDQTATGDLGIFDMRANTVTMRGHVVISRDKNVLKGDNLIVNMTTGDSHMTCNSHDGKCTVIGLFTPSSMKAPEPAPAPVTGQHR
jgi:lipopolysaccharide export system protein LptA